MGDRVVLHRQRAVPTGIGHFELVGLEHFLARLDAHAQIAAVLVEHAGSSFVQRKRGVDQIAMVREEIHDAAEVGRDDFLVAGRNEDEVPLGAVAFLPVANEVCDEHRDHRLVVSRATRVEVAVFFDELERVAFPIPALRLHHVEVSEQHDGFFRARAPVAGDEIALLRPARWHDDLHVLRRQPACFQSGSHRLGGGRAAPGGIGGVDLDQLFVNLAQLLLRGGG